MMRNLLYTLLLACFQTLAIAAPPTDSIPTNRFTSHAMSYGIGTVNLLETYLSPQEYTGTQIHFMRETMRKTRWMHGKISTQSILQGNASYTRTQVREGKALAGGISWSVGWHYNWQPAPTLRLMAGTLLDLNGGFVYNTRNGNNPAQGKLATDIAASGAAIYSFKIKNQNFIARYQLNIPLVGLMFSPAFGQSYYELFSLGEYDNNVRFTTPINAPSLSQLISLDVPIKTATFRISYLCDIKQSKVNQLKSHAWSHLFLLGFVKHFSLVKNKDIHRSQFIY
ncbi:MAG: DUF3316 domain-containing protein [Bacteroidaceae bacterium]